MNQTLFLSGTKAQTIFKNPEKCAEVAKLIYVSDKEEGVKRVKRGKAFSYYFKNTKINDHEQLRRFKSLVIPPAWVNVWICHKPNGHIQATGFDVMQRKQYRYHADWNELRNNTKFSRLVSFGEILPQLRAKIEHDIARKELSKEKILATVIKLMETTYIRIGNSGYEKLYGSYGLTTLKDKHVKIEGSAMRFSFKGKKSVFHTIDCRDKRLARIVKQCKEIPGKELFQYYDEHHVAHSIHSEDVNNYLKEITGMDFTAKDFRTWAGSTHALVVLKDIGVYQNATQCKKNMVAALDYVSGKLGNTRTVCKKYYVHPAIFSLYEENKLIPFFHKTKVNNKSVLALEEQVLMGLLKKH